MTILDHTLLVVNDFRFIDAIFVFHYSCVIRIEDLQDGQAFGAVRVVNPFAAPERTPEEILATLGS